MVFPLKCWLHLASSGYIRCLWRAFPASAFENHQVKTIQRSLSIPLHSFQLHVAQLTCSIMSIRNVAICNRFHPSESPKERIEWDWDPSVGHIKFTSHVSMCLQWCQLFNPSWRLKRLSLRLLTLEPLTQASPNLMWNIVESFRRKHQL